MGAAALYEIEHISRYLYTTPVRHGVLSLCLKPRDDAGQRLLSFEIATSPPASLNSETDIFGNTKQIINVHREHRALEIVSRSVVERTPSGSPLGPRGADAWERIRSWSGAFTHWEFTHPSLFARPSPALTAFVDESGIEVGDDPLETLLQLSDTLNRSFEYVPGSTSAVSPIEHVLESRQGVCQDYVHVMITIARSWSVPARYVSGYLYTDSYDGDGLSHTATHAWVECRLPELGWIGIDPTNSCLAAERHVRVAIGRDYQDVAPTRGVFVGEGESRLDVEVRVRRA